MKKLTILFCMAAMINVSYAQLPQAEVFQQHMTALTDHKIIQRTFLLVDDEQTQHLYIELGCYDDYFRQEPFEIPGHKVFLWKEGSIFFFDVQLWLELVKIRYQEDEMAIYEFVSQAGKRKFFIEAKFVQRYGRWELADMRRTRLKPIR